MSVFWTPADTLANILQGGVKGSFPGNPGQPIDVIISPSPGAGGIPGTWTDTIPKSGIPSGTYGSVAIPGTNSTPSDIFQNIFRDFGEPVLIGFLGVALIIVGLFALVTGVASTEVSSTLKGR